MVLGLRLQNIAKSRPWSGQGIGKVLTGSDLADLRHADRSRSGAIIPDRPRHWPVLTTAQALGSDRARLLPVLAAVPDPRARRGVRHRLAVVLGLAVCAVLAGARSFTAITEWAAAADRGTRDAPVPCESTFQRTLQHLDADALDDAVGAWARQRTTPAPGERRVIAVDGKTLRGSAAGGEAGRHLRLPSTTPGRGPGPDRRRGQDQRDPDVRHTAGAHRRGRGRHHRGRPACPARPRRVPSRPARR
jgi:DDE_Tnp_1-associated